MAVTIGVDIRQKRDPTALCVAGSAKRTESGRPVVHFVIRYLDRLPLGTPYPAVAHRVAELVQQVKARKGRTPRVYMDAAGVGQPVVIFCRNMARR